LVRVPCEGAIKPTCGNPACPAPVFVRGTLSGGGGFSRVEQTLLGGGRGAAVLHQRMGFQDLMRERFEAVIERAAGRPVIGLMSGNQQHPDMMCEVLILALTDLVDEPELAKPGHQPREWAPERYAATQPTRPLLAEPLVSRD
jgi:hypothetical protein